ncbi:MAG: hypothetical protein HQM10_21450 [Candidatus Riflebacteria bacterium]|nr:hypothetical protein [Candidatus Riflebacteria bacterium]
MIQIGEHENVVVASFEQKANFVELFSPEWRLTMIEKLRYVLFSIDAVQPFVHADCDIVYYRPFTQRLLTLLTTSGLDLIFQADSSQNVCLGFFVCKPTKRTYDLFAASIKLLEEGNAENFHQAFNKLLNSQLFSDIKYGLLGSDAYSIWRQTDGKLWDSSQPVNKIFDAVFMHHANFTVGIDNKLNLITKVRENMVFKSPIMFQTPVHYEFSL